VHSDVREDVKGLIQGLAGNPLLQPDTSASKAATAAALVANLPRRTRRRCPAADGRSALKYHDHARVSAGPGSAPRAASPCSRPGIRTGGTPNRGP
jgi:hypothetical protein